MIFVHLILNDYVILFCEYITVYFPISLLVAISIFLCIIVVPAFKKQAIEPHVIFPPLFIELAT